MDFIAAQALLISGLAGTARSPFFSGFFAAAYLVTASGLILLTFSALLQWTPASMPSLPDKKIAIAALTLLETGALAIVSELFAWRADAAWFAPYLPLAGGVLIAIGTLLAIGNVAPALLRMKPSSLPGRLMLAGFVFLFLTLMPGLVWALSSEVPGAGTWLMPLNGSGMELFAFAGLGGWLIPTAIGACYKLLPMVMRAPDGRSAVSEAVLWLCVAGTVLTLGADVVNLYLPQTALATMTELGLAIVAIGIILYFAEVSHVRIYGIDAKQPSDNTTTPQWSHRPHRSTR